MTRRYYALSSLFLLLTLLAGGGLRQSLAGEDARPSLYARPDASDTPMSG